ncbi:hypothetical protein CBR_g6416 [Chara braunii]|uniref:Expansin n=1 Tax=Chara braunii TaxID=69332 RepID=A0A388KJS8_CHABU|nr:hypothetical protein CBR_g6416 [Chara braunii]|eukprot:GBG70289.1 hypothetical protein CBR_g6416 [Chara braunii]
MDAKFGSQFARSLAAVCLLVACCCVPSVDGGILNGVANRLGLCNPPDEQWQSGTGTFYSGGHGGACGFAGLGYSIFAENYVAVSTALWNSGAACGTCLEVRCKGPSSACIAGATIKVTVTDFCPNTYPNLAHCGTDKHHLDLGENVFPKIAARSVGVIDLEYRRVPCVQAPSITVSVEGNQYGYLALNLMRLPGAGTVAQLEIKGANGAYEQCRRDWGNTFVRTGKPIEAPLSLRVSVGGICTFEAKDCIKSLNFGSSVTCSYN